jgi:phosphoribosylformimino-5-aminoimidazole carboxamide ribotide isomerase
MQIWPAIDLRGGKCVRLQQGDYGRETVFSNDPEQIAREFHDAGAKYLHLVDLDGARSGRVENWDAIQAIVKAAPLACELGGGIRDEATIGRLLDLGLQRLVIGTLAIRQPEWFRKMCRAFPGRMVLGIDARDGQVATDGWLETSRVSAVEMAQDFAGEPLAAIVYTDIAKDGMLQGPNIEALDIMRQAVSLPVVASGGVTTADDVSQLAALPMAGCIIGRALYEGTLTLKEALERAGAASLTEERPV